MKSSDKLDDNRDNNNTQRNENDGYNTHFLFGC